MRALVVYESMFGNTRDIARAIADGLSPAAEVQVVEVSRAPQRLEEGVRLLVVGAPTHAFGMSRPKTRADAATQATHQVISAGIGVREWLERLAAAGRATAQEPVAVATFDTRISRPRVPGSAARGAAKRLSRAGFHLVAHATSFFVSGTDGPLEPGELDRARSWGAELGRLVGAEAAGRKRK